MERSPMLADWVKLCENGHTTKITLHVQCNPYQNFNGIVHNNRKINHEIHIKLQKTSNSQNNSEQKSKAGGIIIPDFKLYYRAIILKTEKYWQKNRQEDQWIKIEEPDITLHIYRQLMFDKAAQNT
jgi:hypothetical protein